MLIPLIMPVDVPLWMVGLATAFSVVIGKEVFGGTGMTRDDLLRINSEIVRDCVIRAAQYSPYAFYIIVSNPLNVMRPFCTATSRPTALATTAPAPTVSTWAARPGSRPGPGVRSPARATPLVWPGSALKARASAGAWISTATRVRPSPIGCRRCGACWPAAAGT